MRKKTALTVIIVRQQLLNKHNILMGSTSTTHGYEAQAQQMDINHTHNKWMI